MLNFQLLPDATLLVGFSWLKTQIQELEHVILIQGIVLFVKMSKMD
jgi:hypothetical protein